MTRKKSIELVQEVQSPKALIINGGEVSLHLEKTLCDRGCEVVKLDLYSPTSAKFNYIFLFDNQELADEIYEKNLSTAGKFLLIATESGGDFRIKSTIKILKIGELSLWNFSELAEKILRVMFSSNQQVLDVSRKSTKAKLPFQPRHSGLSRIDSGVAALPRMTVEQATPILEKTSRFSPRKIFIFLAVIILLSAALLAAFSFWHYSKIRNTFTNLNYHLKTANVAALSADLRSTKEEISILRSGYKIGALILFPIKDNPFLLNINDLLESAQQTAASSLEFIDAAQNVPPQAEKLDTLQKKTGDLLAILIETQQRLDKLKIKYSLSPIISRLTSVYDLMPAISQMFLSEGTKVYLVLLQNNMELRPTGGFIGSYGLLTISSGKITDFKIEDVYTADGQLKGHVDPPEPIRKYLGQPHFFLRDSNFDPDFAATSLQAMWFLQKELGKEVDGVIGINLTLAQKVMQLMGPITLSDFGKEEINSTNFFHKVHNYSAANFFPGSTQKKDVLTAIYNEIMGKFTGTSQINFIDLLSVAKTALEEKNILLYFKDENLQKTVEGLGWAGRLANVSCVEQKSQQKQQDQTRNNCFADYISINEANLGVNKANYYINKSHVVEKKIGNGGQISTAVTIFYENQNINPTDTGQTYVNYLRIFVPKDSNLESFTLNNASISPADIDSETYGGDKTVFGVLVKIAPGNKGVVKITYTLPRPLSTDNDNGSYQLFYQKQAGDKNSPLIFSLTYPPEFKLAPLNFSSTSQRDGEIFYTTDTSVDRVFALIRE